MRVLALLFSFTLISLPGLVTAGDAGSIDLYHVAVRSDADARILTRVHADVLMAAGDGYLILADAREYELLAASGLEYELIATDIDRQHLAVDFRTDPSIFLRFPVVFERYGKRLLRVEPTDLQDKLLKDQILPIRTRIPRVEYREPARLKSSWDADYLDLDSLINRVNQDSIRSFVEQLQAFPVRLRGTNGAYLARNWLVNKFHEFGYDSVVLDPFTSTSDEGAEVSCRNVIAYKPGTEYSYHQIIVGGHFDAEAGSPGADDNGSGAAGVLEIARVLSDIDTKVTFIFIPFDGEEAGSSGSAHYAEQAALAGDNIILMANMDMIGHFENDTMVYVFGGDDLTFGQLWVDLADSIPSIDLHGVLLRGNMSSDDASFSNFGYSTLGLHEYIFSTHFHDPSDSAVYINFDYATRIVKANLATLAVTDAAVVLPPRLILAYPDSISEIIIPGESNPLRIKVMEYAGGQLIPGSVLLHYRVADGEWSSTPMISAGSDIYEVELPTPECGEKLTFYVRAEEVASGLYYAPDTARPFFANVATGSTIVFEDSFNTDKGWTVTGDSFSGYWERLETGSPGGRPDYDGSRYCYVSRPNRIQTILTSPSIELVTPDTRIRFAFYYYNTCSYCGEQDDVFVIGVYNGDRFDTLEIIGPVEGVTTEWQTRDYKLSDYCVPVSPIRLCFIAADEGESSSISARVDAVTVVDFTFTPNIFTPALPEAAVGVPYLQQLEATSCSPPLTWTDTHNELPAIGLSLSTDGIISGTAADTGHVWLGAVAQDTSGRTGERWYRLRIKFDYNCGDANGDKMVNVADAVFLISYVFKGGPAPVPKNAGDANDDSWVNVGDAVYLINYVFHGGPPPAAGC